MGHLVDVESDRRQHDNSFGDELDIGTPAGQLHAVGEDGHDQDACDDAGELSFTASDRDAAKKDAGDDGELRTRSRSGMGGTDPRYQHDRAQGDEESLEEANHQLRLRDVDAGESGGFFIATQGVNVSAVVGLVQEDRHDDDEDEGQQDGKRQGSDIALGDELEGRIETAEVLGFRDREGDAVVYGHRADGHHQQGDLQLERQDSVDLREDDAFNDRNQQYQRCGHAQFLDQQAHRDADQRHLVAHRQVDLASHHD